MIEFILFPHSFSLNFTIKPVTFIYNLMNYFCRFILLNIHILYFTRFIYYILYIYYFILQNLILYLCILLRIYNII